MIRNLPITRQAIMFGVLLFLVSGLFSQTYILNEDFSSASGSTPPTGWTITTITGTADDLWRFDNPGFRPVNYPAVGRMAMMDAQAISNDSIPEEVILESRYLDCSGSFSTLIMFHHWFVPGEGATGTVEVWDGFHWHEVKQYTDSTANVTYELINISEYAGGVSDAKVRFRWSGDGSGWWAIDNFKVYAPLALDAAIENITSPTMPFTSGNQPIKASIANLGINTITSLTFNWEINGVAQTPFYWTGSLEIGETDDEVTLGTYHFQDGQMVNLRIWISDPNGQLDMNDQNNELNTILYGSLSGIYTIGGIAPDFVDFSQAVTVLNTAGVAGPVTFMVRDGIYDEQILIG